ncbi:uncharacterized protein PV06_00428 [Exophiala oligosperma]|uniref:Uncharacterized protein n=1 Tax=Exophiala oligosperma TaxID=215243 RepID=A0A0D2DYU6_9EURO|nr:uncharacterized protein PV06_00428 [Exophiala oligosperma]KIW47765.1 hypothetical protein PV06_00428 [Exophiala oligosperma]
MATKDTPNTTDKMSNLFEASSEATSASTSPNESFTTNTDPSGSSTPLSSLTDLALTQFEPTGTEVNDGTLKLNKTLDHKLSNYLESETIDNAKEITKELPPAYKRRFAFDCAFGFTGSFDEPEAPPKTKGAFLDALIAEMDLVGKVQAGLQAYQHAINSRKHHTFQPDFLIGQNTATIITLDQLDQISAHLEEVKEEVDRMERDDADIKDELFDAFRHAQPWVARTRAILVHSHVFYKINFVLASDKNATKA